MNKGILVVVSGFSGAGKGTVMKRLMEKYDGYALSVSATTRKPRPGEEDGREYFFRTRDEFEKLIEEDALLEYAQYVENYYGTPRSYVEEQLQAGRNVILEIEIQGAMKIKEKIPEALLVFVTPPTVEELERRLTGRGTETAQVIADRLARASEEAEGMGQYDFFFSYHIIYLPGNFCKFSGQFILFEQYFLFSVSLCSISCCLSCVICLCIVCTVENKNYSANPHPLKFLSRLQEIFGIFGKPSALPYTSPDALPEDSSPLVQKLKRQIPSLLPVLQISSPLHPILSVRFSAVYSLLCPP